MLEKQRLQDPRVRREQAFVQQACKELRDAAISHLQAVSKIRKIFHEIYRRQDTPVEPRQVLEQLEAQVREEAAAVAREGEGGDADQEATVMSFSSQFVLFSLWTRFGMRGTRDDEEECLKDDATIKALLEFEEKRKGRRAGGRLKQPGTLSVIRVARHSLQSQREAQSRNKSDKKSEVFVRPPDPSPDPGPSSTHIAPLAPLTQPRLPQCGRSLSSPTRAA